MSDIKICDLHCDTAQAWQAGLSIEDPATHVSLPHLKVGGVGLQVFAAYVPASLPGDRRFPFVCRTIECIREQIGRFPSRITLCTNARQVGEAVGAGRIAALLAVENGDAIGNELTKLERLHAMGVRLMTLIHTRSNDWIVSSTDEKPAFDGLSPFGLEVVQAMNDLGMIIDVSHAHDRAVERVLEQSRHPIVASHSCMHALCPIPRNIRDELVRGIAAGGGVVGINFSAAFLDCEYRRIAEKRGKESFGLLDRRSGGAGEDPASLGRAWMKFTRAFGEAMHGETVPLETLLKHVDHLVEVAGEDAAAFGSDFDGIPTTPEGLEDCRGFQNIVRGLQARGYTRQRVEKICWSNALRVLRGVCR